ncbi:hypothetical protein GGF31_008768 [Allomyces arbusculus]|nr:hypothetical protein GGF31_008768 [Allomyces arbusculus]
MSAPSTPPSTSPAPPPPPAGAAAAKVVLRFHAIGDAPILRRPVFRVSANQKFAAVAAFLRRELGLAPDASLFLYVNQAFAPAPDELMHNLDRCFADAQDASGTRALRVHYCTTAAWG